MTQKTQTIYHVYYIKDIGRGKTAWVKVGAAFPNQDGKGFNLSIDVLPLNFDGELTIRQVDNTNGTSVTP